MPVKEHPSFILTLCGKGTEKEQALLGRKAKGRKSWGLYLLLLGTKDQLDS